MAVPCGACHEYLLPLTDLPQPLVFYEQIGNGRSTHLPEKNGDEEFWSVDLFARELDNLIHHLDLQQKSFDIIGHSWGEMLAVEWIAASAYAANLRRLVISNSLASIDVCRVGITALRRDLPEDVQAVLDHADQTEEFETLRIRVCHRGLLQETPQSHQTLAIARGSGCFGLVCKRCYYVWNNVSNDFCRKIPTYSSRDEPSELYISGSLRNWASLHLLDRVNVPTLLINGTADQAKDVAMQHFF